MKSPKPIATTRNPIEPFAESYPMRPPQPHRSRPFALSLAVALGVMVAGCVGGGGSGPQSPTAAPAPTQALATDAATAPVATVPLSQDQIAAVPLAGPGAAAPAMVTTSQGDAAQGTQAVPAPGAPPVAPAGVGAVIPDPGAAPPTTAPTADPAATACAAIGGSWVRAGSESGGYACVRPMLDAGKICRKKGDCAGQCLARSATCAPIEPLFGCNDIIDANGQWVTQCIN